jgi:hypothetical protein
VINPIVSATGFFYKINQTPDPDKPEITNDKHQITNKFQFTISKPAGGGSSANCLVRRRRIGHCDLFVI